MTEIDVLDVATHLQDLSNRICVPNKIRDLNLNAFNIIARTSEPIILTKQMSSKSECKFSSGKCNSNYKWKWM